MNSIRTKVTFGIILCSLISAVIISFMSMSNARSLSNADAENELALTCENTSSEIHALISRIEQSVHISAIIRISQTPPPEFS